MVKMILPQAVLFPLRNNHKIYLSAPGAAQRLRLPPLRLCAHLCLPGGAEPDGPGRFPVAEKYITMGASLLSCSLLLAIVVFYFMGAPKNDFVDDSLKSPKDTTIVYESIPLAKLPYSTNAKINITGFSGGNLEINSHYGLQLKNLSDFNDYHWVVEGDGVLIGTDSLKVTGNGEVKISCIDSHNYIIVSRIISKK